jgi:hypothetical protein
MRYDRDNVMPGTKCIDAKSGKELERVLAVDTDKCEVEIAHYPYRVAADGESIETFVVAFEAISTGIHPRTGLPNEFKCYGPRA